VAGKRSGEIARAFVVAWFAIGAKRTMSFCIAQVRFQV